MKGFENKIGKQLQLKKQLQDLEQRIKKNRKIWQTAASEVRCDGQLREKLYKDLLASIE